MANKKISALQQATELTGKEKAAVVQGGITKKTSSGSLGGGFFVNPFDYGAVGDGANDDSSAIQAAIDTGKPVKLPPGTFRITSQLELGQSDFVGAGAKNTIIECDGCNCLVTPLTTTRISTQIGGFSIYSSAENCQETAAVSFTKDTGNTGNRSSGFKFYDIEIGKQGLEQFGAAFYIADAFRVGLINIGINNCHNALLLVGQVVQFSAINVYSNYDQQFACAGFDGVEDPAISYGLYVGGSNHTGTYQLPESIQVVNCGFVMHEVGLYNFDSLHARFINSDFDYCRLYGVRVYATNGFTIKDCYIALTGADALHGIRFEVSAFEIKNVNVENNFITTIIGATDADKIGIFMADNFREGGYIARNEFRAGDASSKWKNAIYMSSSKKFTITQNAMLPSSITDEAIYLDSVEDFNLTENFCPGFDILFTTGAGSCWVHNNICDAISQTLTGTAVGYSFQPNNVVLKNANISSGLLQYDPSGVLKTGMIDTAVDFDDLTITGEYANTHNTNSPNAGYGIYYVSVRRSATAITQFALPPVVDTSPTTVKAYIRSSADSGANWTAWRQFAMV